MYQHARSKNFTEEWVAIFLPQTSYENTGKNNALGEILLYDCFMG
jgi:hypothetical protein